MHNLQLVSTILQDFQIILIMPTLNSDEEERIAMALRDKEKSRFKTWKDASRYYYVNYDVLRVRAKGRKGNASKEGRNRRLNTEQEAVLKLYCERCILTGHPPERAHINAAANSILRAIGKPPVSKPWLSRWLKANRYFLKPRRMKPIASVRKAVHEYEDISNYFRRFEQAISEYNIKPENYWNADNVTAQLNKGT